MKFIHISDLHIPVKIPIFALRGKMISGYLNFALRRRKLHPMEAVERIIEFIKASDYDCLILSGDITNVSHKKEFEETRKILAPILNEKAFLIPGNHDRYMTSSVEPVDLYKKYFGEFSGEEIPNAQGEYIRVKKVKDLTLIGWDSNEPTPIAIATGYVKPQVPEITKKFLQENKIQKYAVICHHPVWSPPDGFESEYHKMKNRGEVVSSFLTNPPLAYFHGHCHSNWIRNKTAATPYYIINSASSTRLSGPKHKTGFHVGELKDGSLTVKRYKFTMEDQAYKEDSLIWYD
jgi:3',5'-cyclic AMP phosphodiesterase CpdA